MNIITTTISAWRSRRANKKLKAAFKVIEGAGLYVCNIQQRNGANYLVDGKGCWHKIGRG